CGNLWEDLMSSVCLKKIIRLLMTVVALLGARPVSAQVAVVTGKSVEEVSADFKYLAPILEQESIVKQVEAFIQEKTDGKGLDGVDTKQPFGVYVNWPDKTNDLSPWNFPVVYFVPVTDEKRFVELLQKLQFQPQKAEEGLYQLSVPGY